MIANSGLKPPAAQHSENIQESFPVISNINNPLKPNPSPEPPRKDEIREFYKEDGK